MRENRESDMIAMSTLNLNDRNPRKITSDALTKLCESIERDPQFMELRPIIVDESRMILGGNQRFRACQQLGMKSVPSTWVRTATGLTDEQRKLKTPSSAFASCSACHQKTGQLTSCGFSRGCSPRQLRRRSSRRR